MPHSIDSFAKSYAEAKKTKDWFTIDKQRTVAKVYRWAIIDVRDGDTLFKIRVNGTTQFAYDKDGMIVENPSEVVTKAGVTSCA